MPSNYEQVFQAKVILVKNSSNKKFEEETLKSASDLDFEIPEEV